MDSKKSGIRGENEMLSLHYLNNFSIFAQGFGVRALASE